MMGKDAAAAAEEFVGGGGGRRAGEGAEAMAEGARVRRTLVWYSAA
jgi:hypothetical protein